MRRFSDHLEKKCRYLIRRISTKENGTPATLMEREIALTLEQIDSSRSQNRELRERLDQQRLGIETSILNLEPLRHLPGSLFLERTRLKNQLKHTLVRLEQQFQRQIADGQRTLHALQTRLLELWNMRVQLHKNGDFSNPA